MSIPKKGQGLPLNTIIIAIIVLVVLVVIVAIFTGKMSWWSSSIDNQAQVELTAMKVGYGTCHPDAAEEGKFLSEFTTARKSNDLNEESAAKARFQQMITSCGEASSCISPCTK